MPVDTSEARNRETEIKNQILSRFNMDLLVRSPEYIAYRISYNDWFLREVTEKGQVLYESPLDKGGRGGLKSAISVIEPPYPPYQEG